MPDTIEESWLQPMISLRPVTEENKSDILALQVSEHQDAFVANNLCSLEEARVCKNAGGHVFPFGIYHGETPVGFVMIGYGVDKEWTDPPQIAYDNYYIWRLMIDQNHQHKGYGRKALELAMGFVRSFPCGRAKFCWLSYEPENHAAKQLYHSMGFLETGDMDADEAIAAIEI